MMTTLMLMMIPMINSMQISTSPNSCQSPKDSGFHSHGNNSFFPSLDNSRAGLQRSSRGSVGDTTEDSLRPPNSQRKGSRTRNGSLHNKDSAFELEPHSQVKEIVVAGVTVTDVSDDLSDIATLSNGPNVCTTNKSVLLPLFNVDSGVGMGVSNPPPAILPPINKTNGWTNSPLVTNDQSTGQVNLDTTYTKKDSASVLLSYDNLQTCSSTTPLVISPSDPASELLPSHPSPSDTQVTHHHLNGPNKCLTPEEPITEEPQPKTEDVAQTSGEEVTIMLTLLFRCGNESLVNLH